MGLLRLIPPVLLVVGLATESAHAQAAADEEAIRQIEAGYNAAWNRHDAAGMVESFVEDTQFLTVTGSWMKGRAEFQRLQERLQSGQFKDSKRETTDLKIHFLAPEIAVVHTRYKVTGEINAEGQPRPPREGVATRVVRKRGGRWETVAVQTTDVIGTQAPR